MMEIKKHLQPLSLSSIYSEITQRIKSNRLEPKYELIDISNEGHKAMVQMPEGKKGL